MPTKPVTAITPERSSRLRPMSNYGTTMISEMEIGSPWRSNRIKIARAGYAAAFFAALIARHLFFAANEIARRSAAVIVLLGFADSAWVGSESCRSLANLARCAKAIFFLTAVDRFFRGFVV